MNTRIESKWLIFAVGTIVMTAFSVGSAPAGERDRSPGYVDGSEFAELADDDANLIEVSIGSSLLKPLARGIAEKDENAAKLLGGLESIQAVIVEVGERGAERAKSMINEMTADLSRRGWERVARVRESNESVSVLLLLDDDAIVGITVMVMDGEGDGSEVVFVNVAGNIDLEMIGAFSGNFGLPGLAALSEIDWDDFDLENKKSSKKRRSR